MAVSIGSLQGATNITVCPICLESNNDLKFLPCMHTICLRCLHVTFHDHKTLTAGSCPMCKTEFQIPEGGLSKLRSNLTVDKLTKTEMFSMSEPIPVVCEVCADGLLGKSATSYCEDCKEGMCDPCSECHRKMKISRMHSMRPIAMSYESDFEEEARQTYTYVCEQNQKENEVFCRDFNQIVHDQRASGEHSQNELCDAGEVTGELRNALQRDYDELEVLLANTRKQSGDCDEQLAEFVRSYEKAEKHIADRTKAVKELVDRHAASVSEKLRCQKLDIEQRASRLKAEFTESRVALESMQNYCTELIGKADLDECSYKNDGWKSRIHELKNQSTLEIGKLPTINFIPSDSRIDENIDSLTNAIGRTCVSQDMDRTVSGIASSEQYLFLVYFNSTSIEVYDISNLTYEKQIRIDDLLDPFDIVYSRNTLFVSERETPLVHRINLENGTTTTWKVGSPSTKLSITGNGDVLATQVDSSKVFCYTPEGDIIQVFNFSEVDHAIYLRHAIQLGDTVYAVGFVKPNLSDEGEYSLLIERNNSRKQKNEGISLGYHSVPCGLDQPCHLSGYGDKILIADKNNNRLARVDPALEITEDIIPSAAGLKQPFTFCLGEDHQNIYVVDDANKILMFDFDC